MVSERALFIINISLGITALLLLLVLLGIKLPTIGQAQYMLDKEEPKCAVSFGEELTAMADIDRCCLNAREQLGCHREQYQDLDWACSTGAGLKYHLNNKAYNYCRQQPYW